MATIDEIVAVWTLLNANYSYYARQLSAQYGNTRAQDMLDKLLSGIWIPVLESVPGDVLKAAALQYVARGNPYFPQVGELREIAFDLMDMAEGRDATPYDGWAEVLRLMRAHSVYDLMPIQFRDPIAQNALDIIGGMRAVRMCAEISLPVLMSQFIKAYRTLQGRMRDNQRMLPEIRELVNRLSMNYQMERVERHALDTPREDSTEWNG